MNTDSKEKEAVDKIERIIAYYQKLFDPASYSDPIYTGNILASRLRSGALNYRDQIVLNYLSKYKLESL